MTHTVSSVKRLRAPSVKKLLRERGYTMADVARNIGVNHSVISRAVRKKGASDRALAEVARLLNQPEREQM